LKGKVQLLVSVLANVGCVQECACMSEGAADINLLIHRVSMHFWLRTIVAVMAADLQVEVEDYLL
jgi:hypothetical protein